jgi:hypothetical protein
MTDTLNKEEFVEKLCDAIVSSYDRESLEAIVWDLTYDEMMGLEWVDLQMHAEDYGVHE